MSSSDFRQITIETAAPKGERLFRAAVSAFCSLTRPSRREIAALEDLTLPLFDCVSRDSRRYVAAALSECRYPPTALVKRLCEEPVDVAAPLLIRSTALTDIDMIALIGRHGHGHARAIGRRQGLNPAIAKLVAALESKQTTQLDGRNRETSLQQDNSQPEEPTTEVEVSPGEAAENARRRLRAMMRPAAELRPAAREAEALVGASLYVKLRDTALTGNRAFFQTALADLLEIDFQAAGRIVGGSSYTWLLTSLRALDLDEDQAFLIAAAIYPQHFAHPEAIRLFLSRFSVMQREAALARVDVWKAESAAAATHDSLRGANLQHLDAEPRSRIDLRVRSAR